MKKKHHSFFSYVEVLSASLFLMMLFNLCLLHFHFTQKIQQHLRKEKKELLEVEYAYYRLQELFFHFEAKQSKCSNYFRSEQGKDKSYFFRCFLDFEALPNLEAIVRLNVDVDNGILRADWWNTEIFKSHNNNTAQEISEKVLFIDELLHNVKSWELSFEPNDDRIYPKTASLSLTMTSGRSHKLYFLIGNTFLRLHQSLV